MNADETILIAGAVIVIISAADIFVSDSAAAQPAALTRLVAGGVLFILFDSGLALYPPAQPVAAGIAVLAALTVAAAYLPNILPFVIPAKGN